ncbi:MAG: hypothetical protein IJN58_08990 [Clostridia bacterium]|nr:hypothetical protein [Clostridia bacterium]
MRKELLPKVERYFKTNLHTHSTISDGDLTPPEVKKLYKDLGYQVLCITDHNIIADHSALNEADFLMLTGVEVNHNHTNYRPRFDGQVYHLNLISKRPDNLWSPGKPPQKYPGGLAYEEKVNWQYMDMSYSPEAVNAMIAKANEMGFLVMYNHPTWSCQTYLDYAPLKGLWAMELRNGECCRGGRDDNCNAHVYKELLNLGNRIYPIGTDDMHRPAAAGMAWIMVGAERLEYGSVIRALEQGDFYMSCGPEIFSLSIDGDLLKITCTDVREIRLESHGRFARAAHGSQGQWLREAEFDIANFFKKADREDMFLRITVTAPDGTYAATRAYFLDELR